MCLAVANIAVTIIVVHKASHCHVNAGAAGMVSQTSDSSCSEATGGSYGSARYCICDPRTAGVLLSWFVEILVRRGLTTWRVKVLNDPTRTGRYLHSCAAEEAAQDACCHSHGKGVGEAEEEGRQGREDDTHHQHWLQHTPESSWQAAYSNLQPGAMGGPQV